MSERMKHLFSTIFIIMIMIALVPVTVSANEPSKNVRVGWYESPFNSMDETGRRSGYAYEYQMKIAAYTGWEYTYVSGSWSELMQLLVEGKIDLMSDVSYTEERAKDMLFADLPMGTVRPTPPRTFRRSPDRSWYTS